MSANRTEKRILLLLAEGFEIFEASVFIDVMGWNRLEGDGTTSLLSCARKPTVKTSFGQSINVDLLFSEVNPRDFDALAIPGGFEEFDFYRDAFSEPISRLVAEFDQLGKPISAICTGALLVANSGVLRGRRATTYEKNPERQQQLAEFGANVVAEPLVVDRNVTTSWNPATAFDVAFGLLETLTSRANADHVRQLMGFPVSSKTI